MGVLTGGGGREKKVFVFNRFFAVIQYEIPGSIAGICGSPWEDEEKKKRKDENGQKTTEMNEQKERGKRWAAYAGAREQRRTIKRIITAKNYIFFNRSGPTSRVGLGQATSAQVGVRGTWPDP